MDNTIFLTLEIHIIFNIDNNLDIFKNIKKALEKVSVQLLNNIHNINQPNFLF